MKAKVNIEKRWVALYFKKMKMWDFYKILKSNRATKHQPTIIAFEGHFGRAIRIVRRSGFKNVPASKWEVVDLDTNGLEFVPQAATKAWGEAIQ